MAFGIAFHGPICREVVVSQIVVPNKIEERLEILNLMPNDLGMKKQFMEFCYVALHKIWYSTPKRFCAGVLDHCTHYLRV